MPAGSFGPNARSVVSDIESRLAAERFAPLEASSDLPAGARFYRRRTVEATKFGMLETFVAVWSVPAPTAAQVEELSARALRLAIEQKVTVPRGLGSAVLSYAVVVMESPPAALRTFIADFRPPRHWSAFEFPVLVDVSSVEVLMNGATPVWGAAYYAGFCREARRLFKPRDSGSPDSPKHLEWPAASEARRRHERRQVRRLQVGAVLAALALSLLFAAPIVAVVLGIVGFASTAVVVGAGGFGVGFLAYGAWAAAVGLAVRAEKRYASAS